MFPLETVINEKMPFHGREWLIMIIVDFYFYVKHWF